MAECRYWIRIGFNLVLNRLYCDNLTKFCVQRLHQVNLQTNVKLLAQFTSHCWATDGQCLRASLWKMFSPPTFWKSHSKEMKYICTPWLFYCFVIIWNKFNIFQHSCITSSGIFCDNFIFEYHKSSFFPIYVVK